MAARGAGLAPVFGLRPARPAAGLRGLAALCAGLPHHYAREFGSAAGHAGRLCWARACGRGARSPASANGWTAASPVRRVACSLPACWPACGFATGLSAVFLPPVRTAEPCCLGRPGPGRPRCLGSVLAIAHQSWGAAWAAARVERAASWPGAEGAACLGVVLAFSPAGLAGARTPCCWCSRSAWRWAGWPGGRAAARQRCDRRNRAGSRGRQHGCQPLAPAKPPDCSACSCSTASPPRFPPRWCCSSSRTVSRPRFPCSRCSC